MSYELILILVGIALETKSVIFATPRRPKRQNGGRKHEQHERDVKAIKENSKTGNGRNGVLLFVLLLTLLLLVVVVLVVVVVVLLLLLLLLRITITSTKRDDRPEPGTFGVGLQAGSFESAY